MFYTRAKKIGKVFGHFFYIIYRVHRQHQQRRVGRCPKHFSERETTRFTFSATATIGSFLKRGLFIKMRTYLNQEKKDFFSLLSHTHIIFAISLYFQLCIIYCEVRIPSFGGFF